MIIPRVHLNGTSRGELLKQLTDAEDAIVTAITALGNAMPHGRDYYPMGDDVILTARAEHRTRIAKLEVVLCELQQLRDGVAEQEAPPGRRSPSARLRTE